MQILNKMSLFNYRLNLYEADPVNIDLCRSTVIGDLQCTMLTMPTNQCNCVKLNKSWVGKKDNTNLLIESKLQSNKRANLVKC